MTFTTLLDTVALLLLYGLGAFAALFVLFMVWFALGRDGWRREILRALAQGPGYGLNLHDRIRDARSDGSEMSQGVLYPLLREMEAQGLVRSQSQPGTAERGGLPRRWYTLTDAGRKAAGPPPAQIDRRP